MHCHDIMLYGCVGPRHARSPSDSVTSGVGVGYSASPRGGPTPNAVVGVSRGTPEHKQRKREGSPNRGVPPSTPKPLLRGRMRLYDNGLMGRGLDIF